MLKRRQLQDVCDLCDQVQIEADRYRRLLQVVLDERKRQPYLKVEEFDTVVSGIIDAKDKLQQVLETLMIEPRPR